MRARHNAWVKEGVPQDSCGICHTIHFAILKLERTGNWKQSRQGHTAPASPCTLLRPATLPSWSRKQKSKVTWQGGDRVGIRAQQWSVCNPVPHLLHPTDFSSASPMHRPTKQKSATKNHLSCSCSCKSQLD